MDLIWRAIDGLVKPDKLLAHLTEQKVDFYALYYGFDWNIKN